MFNFRLSTILLVVALVATALGWYVDRNSKGGITGSWKLANSPIAQLGYSTTLDIRPDGTFSKVQRYRDGEQTFAGTYEMSKPGFVDFHVSSEVYIPAFDIKAAFSDQLQQGVSDKAPATKIDETFQCRWAIDASGCLIVHEYKMLRMFDEVSESTSGIKWEIYAPINAE